MIPKSQFRKKVYGTFDEDFIYFATRDGFYQGSEARVKQLSEQKNIMSMILHNRKLYLGTQNGEIILASSQKLVNKRPGAIHSFVPAIGLYDVSKFIGEYMVHETKKPCGPTQEFWISPSPLVYDYREHLVILGKNGLFDLSGKPMYNFDEEVHGLVNAKGSLWIIQNNLLKTREGETMAELPTDADHICHNNGTIYYLRSTPGLERMMLDSKERTQLFTDHTITTFAVRTEKVKRPIV